MYFDIDKCKSLYFDGRNKSSATVTLDGNEIPIVNCIKDLGIHVQSSISWKSHIQAKLVAARKSFEFLKRTISRNVSVATKLLYYRLCVHSILLYGSQIRYPSISQRRQLELFNRKCLYWVTGLWDYNLQLSRTRTLPISFYLVLQDLIFLNKSIKVKYDLNIQNFICFSSNVRNLRTSHCQLLTPVLKCNKFTSRQCYFQRVCQWSNFLSGRNIDITQSCENFKSSVNAYLHSCVPFFNLDRSCSWFIKCFCSICRS